jgi:hypothetical protein
VVAASTLREHEPAVVLDGVAVNFARPAHATSLHPVDLL